ncbi:MAG TPA: CoA transferase, partial [Rhizomicrobium sp.]|nr:CoA transferase [Rhizomicrobium sp.]
RIPAAPVNELEHAFADPQAIARNMKVQVPLPNGGFVEEPGNPIKMSETYEDSFTAPPRVGADTASILTELLKLDRDKLADLDSRGIIGIGACP